MNDYIIYFSIFNKKLKTTVTANSEEHAKSIVKEMVKFHKVVKVPKDKAVQDLMDFFGMK